MIKERKENRDSTNSVLLSQEGRVSERVELLLSLAHERVETSLHIRKLLSDVVHEHLFPPQANKMNELRVSPRSLDLPTIPEVSTRKDEPG